MYSVLLTVHIIGIVIAFITIIILMKQEAGEEQKLLLLVTMCGFIQGVGYFFEFTSKGLEATVIGVKLEYLGSSYYILLFLLFTTKYLKIIIPKVLPFVIFAIDSCKLFVVMMIETPGMQFIGKLFYADYHLKKDGNFYWMMVGRGVFYYFFLFFDAILMLSVICLIIFKTKKMTKDEKRGILLLGRAAFVLLVLFILYLLGIFGNYDVIPMSVMYAFVFICRAILKEGLFDTQFFAKERVIHRMSQGYICVDYRYRYLEANPFAKNIFPEVRNLNPGDNINGISMLPKLLQCKESDFQVSDRFYRMQIVPIKYKDVTKGFAGWIFDVTDNHRYMERLVALKEEAESANTAKSLFLANMSHEIRTPINVIIGSTELILRENVTPSISENANAIRTAGNGLLGIVNDILDFSKIEAGKLDIVDVDYSFDDMIQDLVNTALLRINEKHIEFRTDISPEIPKKLYGDDIRIKQIVINLLTNAIKFTEKGNVTLTVSVRKTSQSKKNRKISLSFAVTDTGIGIAKDDLNLLFEKFRRLDAMKNRMVEGTGLGLAISQMLATKMEGELHVESEYGKGSTFTLDIDQVVKNQEEIAAAIFKKALVFDDDEWFLSVMKKTLDCENIEYTIAKHRDEFLKLAEQDYDILFTNGELYQSPFLDPVRVNKVIMLSQGETCARRNAEDISIARQMISCKISKILNGTYLERIKKENAPVSASFTAPKARVLIVDDNTLNLRIAAGLLKPVMMQVDLAESGEKAIDMIMEADYDIVFMDHMMPGMDGIETTQLIRANLDQKCQELIVIALTANAVSGAKEKFLEAGMQDFISKPIEMQLLLKKLEKWLPQDKIEYCSVDMEEKG